MKSLYMFYVGGKVKGANIEVHDVQFAIVDEPEVAFPAIAQRWFGEQMGLHVDVIQRINWVDGYDVSITTEPTTEKLGLYFVNMGGYLEGENFERHSFELFAAHDEAGAHAAAKARYLLDHLQPHRDALMDVDDCLKLDRIDGLHIELVPNARGSAEPPLFQGYKPIGDNPFVYDPSTDRLVRKKSATENTSHAV
jgi:Domain of Unknown Function (DUF1543)